MSQNQTGLLEQGSPDEGINQQDPLGLPVDIRVVKSDCNDPAYQSFLTQAHMIELDSFNEAVLRFNDPALLPMELDCNAVYDQINAPGITCGAYKIQLGYNPDALTNTDIQFGIVAGAGTTSYSIALFRGLQKIFPANVTFQFFKAIREIAGVTFTDVIFRIVDVTPPAPKVVYLGDLSELYP